MKAVLSYFWLLIVMAFTQCSLGVVKVSEKEESFTKKINLPSINAVNLNMPAKVIITHSDEQTIEVNAPLTIQELIKTEVVNGIWQIGLTKSVTNFSNVVILIGLPSVTTISNLSTGNIQYTQAPSKARNLNLILDGTGDIEAIINIQSLNVESKGTGLIKVLGKAESTIIKNKSLADYEGYGLLTESCLVTNSSMGKVQVNVSKHLEAVISGTGDIFYRGYPSSIEKNITGNGQLLNAN